MKAEQRRAEIASFLLSQGKPVSGAALAERFGVSRQIIVQDIANLKAAGYDILPTHYGYIVQKSPLTERVFKVFHTKEQTEQELRCIVANGGTVVDVFVWHKVYGKIRAELNIYSDYHIERFIDGVRRGSSVELMNITGGYHYHTVRAESEQILDRVEAALYAAGYIVPEIA